MHSDAVASDRGKKLNNFGANKKSAKKLQQKCVNWPSKLALM
jgi:hypothetical protein